MQRPLFIADHSERLLCPLPLKIEPYSGCSGHCAYCSRAGLRDPVGGEVRANSVKYVEKYFFHSKKCMERELIEQRSPIQIGPASDPLQAAEREAKVTLRVLRILHDFSYPCVMTSKFPGMLTRPEYLQAVDDNVVLQCSISSADSDILRRLEPGAPSLPERLEALRTLHEAGMHVQLRIWPFIPDLAGDLPSLLAAAKDAGVQTILSNPLKIYHNGGSEGINRAIERDYLATTSLKYVNGGLFSIMNLEDQRREMAALLALCRSLGLDMLSCDDWPGSRNWRDCCGVGDLPGFHPSPWAYYMRGFIIKKHTDFETYMRGLDCPWHDEYKAQWEAGKLARALPGLIFHPEDLTYSSITF